MSDEFTALSIELAFAIEPKGPGSSHGASVDFPRNVSCFAKTDHTIKSNSTDLSQAWLGLQALNFLV